MTWMNRVIGIPDDVEERIEEVKEREVARVRHKVRSEIALEAMKVLAVPYMEGKLSFDARKDALVKASVAIADAMLEALDE